MWRNKFVNCGVYRVSLTQDLPDGSLSTGDVLESISHVGKAYVVALPSTDSGPERRNPGRIHRTRKLLTCLHEPDTKLLFRT